jgi:hypothetical protein
MRLFALIVAQNLGEYSGLGGGIAEGVSRIRIIVEDGLRSLDRQTWALILGGLFLLWLVFRRRR